ncbi:uncharacterized protein TNCV_4307131 [Trichonephila clavipes]|nr:uncharacterized protein TNCV_4307131 [Trichonephila clavipes]
MTVSRIWNRWFQDGNTERPSGSQRFPITSRRKDRHIIRMTLMDRTDTSRVLSRELGSFARQQMYAQTPREKVWSMVAERLARHHTPVTTVDELGNRVEAEWASVSVHAIQSLFDSMPRHISAVITAGGDCPVCCFLRIYAP